MSNTVKSKSSSRTKKPASQQAAANKKPQTRLEQLEILLKRADGASITEMIEATGWQAHSVRGAMAGALKKRGNTVTSDKVDGTRRYDIKSAS